MKNLRTAIPIFALVFFVIAFCLVKFNLNEGQRPLTSLEITELMTVFANKVDYSKVKIKTANLPPTMAGIVISNTIIFREEYYREDFSLDYLRMARLVHEVGHVWANQSQGIQTSLFAVWEHLRYGQAVYAHGSLSQNQSLTDFRYEQQCRILGDYYSQRHLGFDISDYQPLINQAFLSN